MITFMIDQQCAAPNINAISSENKKNRFSDGIMHGQIVQELLKEFVYIASIGLARHSGRLM